eukprot:CAMPEP_0197260274 /NCGR_PEP_ID=MMETSP1429-20130617/83950_1 /TAXON_ID=49237 /ORGANISM="Chaetoceros  sp., Strain UNC1202" /LENGTH=458 /DNA_ID=CAMNT_0042724511 /DNA_START=541 /DNA_END=1917 /DNA_ORIENTATION=-
MRLFWDIFYYAIPLFVFILIPFMTFFYEADDGMLMAGTSVGAKPNNRFLEAIKYELFVVFIFASLFVTAYLLLGDSSVPVVEYQEQMNNAVTFTSVAVGTGKFHADLLADMTEKDFTNMNRLAGSNNRGTVDLNMPVDIPTFFAGFMAFVGWFFFALFGGIGLAAVPLDLILAFVNRPKRMDPTEFADAQINVRNRTNNLVDIGELMKIERDESDSADNGRRSGMFSRLSQEARAERAAFLEFKKAVYLLETDIDQFQASSANYDNFNPLLPWFSLFAGILSTIISLVWIIQIGIYIVPPTPIHPFLNMYFQWFDSWFPLFGVLSVAFFTLYLLLCAVKGCFKFGIRFMFFRIHPMKVNKTYMSSFMFNVGLILLCALPVVQFCTTAFPEYARYTHVVQVMGTQVKYLKFFTFFWTAKVFIYALLIVFGMTVIYLFCKPRDDNSVQNKGLLSRLRSRK